MTDKDTAILETAKLREVVQDQKVVLTGDGVNRWGVYFEIVEFRAEGSDWTATQLIRVFVADNILCTYIIGTGQTKSVWRLTKHTSPVETLNAAVKLTNAPGAKLRLLRGSPLLVQLTQADVKLVETGMLPSARYRGHYLHAKVYGKWNPDEPQDFSKYNENIVSKGVSKLVDAAAKFTSAAVEADPEPEF